MQKGDGLGRRTSASRFDGQLAASLRATRQCGSAGTAGPPYIVFSGTSWTGKTGTLQASVHIVTHTHGTVRAPRCTRRRRPMRAAPNRPDETRPPSQIDDEKEGCCRQSNPRRCHVQERALGQKQEAWEARASHWAKNASWNPPRSLRASS